VTLTVIDHRLTVVSFVIIKTLADITANEVVALATILTDIWFTHSFTLGTPTENERVVYCTLAVSLVLYEPLINDALISISLVLTEFHMWYSFCKGKQSIHEVSNSTTGYNSQTESYIFDLRLYLVNHWVRNH